MKHVHASSGRRVRVSGEPAATSRLALRVRVRLHRSRLEDPTPVNPCGVARALVLLSDGGSPLYSRCSQRAMGDAVWWVADGLQGSSAGDQ